MSDLKTQKCDGENCGKLRANDSNHWLVGWIKNGVISLALMENPEAFSWLAVSGTKHFCGEQCASRWFLAEMGKLKGAHTVIPN
jgi:hypothetical protein